MSEDVMMRGNKRNPLVRSRCSTRDTALWPDWYIVGQQDLRRRRMARKRRRGWA